MINEILLNRLEPRLAAQERALADELPLLTDKGYEGRYAHHIRFTAANLLIGGFGVVIPAVIAGIQLSNEANDLPRVATILAGGVVLPLVVAVVSGAIDGINQTRERIFLSEDQRRGIPEETHKGSRRWVRSEYPCPRTRHEHAR